MLGDLLRLFGLAFSRHRAERGQAALQGLHLGLQRRDQVLRFFSYLPCHFEETLGALFGGVGAIQLLLDEVEPVDPLLDLGLRFGYLGGSRSCQGAAEAKGQEEKQAKNKQPQNEDPFGEFANI